MEFVKAIFFLVFFKYILSTKHRYMDISSQQKNLSLQNKDEDFYEQVTPFFSLFKAALVRNLLSIS